MLNITNINSNTLTSGVAHELKIGEPVTVQTSSVPGLSVNQVFYVLTTPTSTTFQLSTEKNGTLFALTNDAAPNLIINTSVIVNTVPITTTYYVDIVNGVDARVIKNYWIRHKIVRV